jgi:hypothetical protein
MADISVQVEAISPSGTDVEIQYGVVTTDGDHAVNTLVVASSLSGPARNAAILADARTFAAATFGTLAGSDYLVGGLPSGQPYINLFSKGAPNTIGTTSEGSGVSATNIGTNFKYIGMYALVKMDGYATIRLLVDANNASGQAGTVTVEVWNVTDGASLVSLTFTSSTRARYEQSAAISLTGIKMLAARVKSTTATHDPVFHAIDCQLEK